PCPDRHDQFANGRQASQLRPLTGGRRLPRQALSRGGAARTAAGLPGAGQGERRQLGTGPSASRGALGAGGERALRKRPVSESGCDGFLVPTSARRYTQRQEAAAIIAAVGGSRQASGRTWPGSSTPGPGLQET